MKLRRAVTNLHLGLIENILGWNTMIASHCQFQPYNFSKKSKKTKEEARNIFRRFKETYLHPLKQSDPVVEIATDKVCPAIVRISREKEIGGSGIIIDSKGTILTCARNIYPRDFRSQINVSLLDRRKFSGTILHTDKKHRFALLKIQSNIPLPVAKFGSLADNNGRALISVEHMFRSPSSQNEVDEEGNLMLSNDELEYEECYVGSCGGGPIVNLYGEVVGISTDTMIFKDGGYGVINGVAIEEAFCSVGYLRNGNQFPNGKTLSWLKWMRYDDPSFGIMQNRDGFLFLS